MKTQLPQSIDSIDQAKKLLNDLWNNNESFHPEDDATELAGDPFTKEEGDKLNKLMENIYNLPGNDGRHFNLTFDPCEYFIELMTWDDDNPLNPTGQHSCLDTNNDRG